MELVGDKTQKETGLRRRHFFKALNRGLWDLSSSIGEEDLLRGLPKSEWGAARRVLYSLEREGFFQSIPYKNATRKWWLTERGVAEAQRLAKS
jgi:hypothetical protein